MIFALQWGIRPRIEIYASDVRNIFIHFAIIVRNKLEIVYDKLVNQEHIQW